MPHIASGQTQPGDWVDYKSYAGGVGDGIIVEVDTSSGRFTTTPHYLVSLECTSTLGGIWRTTGGSAVYEPTPTGFRVYLGWSDTEWAGGPNQALYPNPPTAKMANDLGWYVRWTGIEAT